MIDDPIFIGSDNCLLKKYINKTIFMESKRKLRYAVITVADRKNISINDWWFISTSGRGNPFYFISGVRSNSYVNAAVFLDNLMVKYPDHFEWLLFHPEWLP